MTDSVPRAYPGKTDRGKKNVTKDWLILLRTFEIKMKVGKIIKTFKK